jgi:hypothetical protein
LYAKARPSSILSGDSNRAARDTIDAHAERGQVSNEREGARKMDKLDHDYPHALLATHTPPCLSLYQPTHATHPDNQQDVIRFRNLVKSLEASLQQQGHRPRDVAPLLEPLDALAGDRAFWNHALQGLAVLRNPDDTRVYRLQRSVPELAIVADSFHTKPLLRIQQSADRYQILALSRAQARLYEGNRDELAEIDVSAVIPLANDVGAKGSELERATRIYGATTAEGTTRHGTGGERHFRENETERFFRAVDRAVIEHYSQPSGLPLLLATLPENRHAFRTLTTNPRLLDVTIDVNPNDLSETELRERAWQAILPSYVARLATLLDAIHAATARHAGSLDLADVVRAAHQGRVATLLIDADRRVAGTVDAATGTLVVDPRADAAGADVLDDVGEQVLRTGGEVIVVPSQRMPSDSGVAAVYRY